MSIFTKKKILDFVIYGSGQAINIVSPLFVMPYLIYTCGVEGLGKVGAGMSVALILNGIVDYGSYINGVKEISVNREDKDILESKFHAIYLSKLILLVIMLLVFSLLIFFVPFFAKEKTLYFLSIAIVVGQFINPAWFFQGIENFKWLSFVNVSSKIIYILLVFIFIRSKSDYVYANLFLGVGAIIANLGGLFWLMRQHSFSFGKGHLPAAKAILKEEFTFSLSQFFLSLYQFFPILLISYIAGDLMAGQYRVIDQIVSIFKTYLNMFFYFAYANICYEISRSLKKGFKVWKQYNGVNFVLILVLVSIFFIFADVVFSYFNIEQQLIPAVSSNFKLALSIPLVVAVSQPLRQLMFAFDKNSAYVRITILMTLLNLGLMAVLLPLYGLKGSFLSIIFIEFVIIALYTVILKRHLKPVVE